MIAYLKNFFSDKTNTTKMKKILLFKKLNKIELNHLSQYLIERHFKKDEVIYSKNFPHVVLYFIISGQVDLYLEKDDTNITFVTLIENQHFGEMGLFNEGVRISSAKAVTDCTLMAISKYDFVKFISKYPASGIKLLYNLTEDIAGKYHSWLINEFRQD
ncbi:MAG: cyclic nucleotide-binding domain-containing protein [Candidatus Cloacimonadales bacterium]|jgi:CRP-like cAMP-binding protein|nr:cyclic nucleotide-binding domain-containing protein [Candidatus Cloacimonadota bacterium]MDD2649661.1 cyclic nucleotide-binding domain-containing protein [Candidatus Cloacimonadota bacterium]MDD3501166.1 cyclic nucleotide-binding domain-containing protein [Candidatus Cloacimonadota bacterium]MDX9976934.1 cyclic nucleotide-binding domain-containing protein [Candidatus Cloacimonadales bacterium]